MKRVWLPLMLLLWLSPGMAEEAVVAPVLDEIRFVGNESTRESVMRQEMTLHEGQPYTPEQIEKSRQALMNLGLFKSVRAEVVDEEGRHVLQVTVDERFYFLPLPLLDYRPGFLGDETATNYSYGGEMRFDNLFGLNQRLKLRYEEKKYVDDVEPPSNKLDVNYTYPRIIGTPYRLEVTGERKVRRVDYYENDVLLGDLEQRTHSGSFFLSRWLSPDGLSEGWHAGGGVRASTIDYEDAPQFSGYDDTQIISLLAGIGYYRVDQFPYHRSGQEFNYSAELAEPAWSSDLEYMRNTLVYRRYQPLKNLDANINSQIKLGLAFGDGQAYSLGGSTSLRGYEKDMLKGNLLFQGNFEYHHHLSGYRQLRGVVFLDVANVWPDVAEINSDRLYTGVGVGARWRVQSFVDITLSVDFAYNTDTGETKSYLETSGSF